MQDTYTLESMEHELCLALKCQFLLSHPDDALVFPKTVEIMTDLRAITTLYLDDILNAEVETDES